MSEPKVASHERAQRRRRRVHEEWRDIWVMVEVDRACGKAKGFSGQMLSTRRITGKLFHEKLLHGEYARRLYNKAALLRRRDQRFRDDCDFRLALELRELGLAD